MKIVCQIALIWIIMITHLVALKSQCIQPEYCNRICWDPTEMHPPASNPSLTEPTHIIVHHTGDGLVWPQGTDYAELVRFYWDFHVNTNGWSDVAYNWLIGRNGEIFEGRCQNILGAHFSCMSSRTMGVAMIGDFTLEHPSDTALRSLEKLIAWESWDKCLLVDQVSRHVPSDLRLSTVSGHRDGNNSPSLNSCASGTTCPGPNLYDLLDDISKTASAMACFDQSSLLDCTSADTLTCDSIYTFELSTQESNVCHYGCNNWSETGPERVHVVRAPYDGLLEISISNFSGDLDVYILASCNPNDCIGTVNSSSASLINAEAGVLYYVVVDADDGSGSGYDIQVECPVRPSGIEDVFWVNGALNSSQFTVGDSLFAEFISGYDGPFENVPKTSGTAWFSRDSVLDSTDIFIDRYLLDLNKLKTTDTLTLGSIIPFADVGTYYLIALADSDDILNESKENNNFIYFEFILDEKRVQDDLILTNII